MYDNSLLDALTCSDVAHSFQSGQLALVQSSVTSNVVKYVFQDLWQLDATFDQGFAAVNATERPVRFTSTIFIWSIMLSR